MSFRTAIETLSKKVGIAAAVLLGTWAAPGAQSTTNDVPKQERWFQYTNDINDEVPLSIHMVRVELSHKDFELCTSLGKGTTLGMAIVSEQVKGLPPECGQPLAAINGDFYEKSEKYMGRARDVQIHMGEVISTPAGHTSFWMDADGVPHMTNVVSRFRVIWPDGKTTPIGLNQLREDDAAVLFTAVTGSSTRTTGGSELILEQGTNGLWLPLRIGQVFTAKVREIRASGDAPITRDT